MRKKKICLISTGGTIASEKGEYGLRPEVTAKKIITMMPELADFCEIEFEEILQLDSSNLLPEHWQLMARTIAKHYDKCDGFVLSHGTDTMAYSAAALHFMLKNLAKPVVLTGSQLPIEAENSDAPGNLLAAFHAAVSSRPGVYIAFDGHIIDGKAAKKLYTKDFHAFHSINQPEAGIFEGQDILWQTPAPRVFGEFTLIDKLDTHIAVLKLFPGVEPELLKMMIDAGYHAIIIEGYGLGGVPNADSPKNFLPMIEYAMQRGVLIVCATQCTYDGVQLDFYEVGVMAERLGAISAGHLTIEALVPKLMLLLGRNRAHASVKRGIEVEDQLS